MQCFDVLRRVRVANTILGGDKVVCQPDSFTLIILVKKLKRAGQSEENKDYIVEHYPLVR